MSLTLKICICLFCFCLFFFRYVWFSAHFCLWRLKYIYIFFSSMRWLFMFIRVVPICNWELYVFKNLFSVILIHVGPCQAWCVTYNLAIFWIHSKSLTDMSIIGTFLTARRLSSWPDDKLGKKLMQKILYYTLFYKNLSY